MVSVLRVLLQEKLLLCVDVTFLLLFGSSQTRDAFLVRITAAGGACYKPVNRN